MLADENPASRAAAKAEVGAQVWTVGVKDPGLAGTRAKEDEVLSDSSGEE